VEHICFLGHNSEHEPGLEMAAPSFTTSHEISSHLLFAGLHPHTHLDSPGQVMRFESSRTECKGMALEQEVYAQAPGASRSLERSEEQCVSEQHDTVEGLTRERKWLFSGGNGSIIAHGWDRNGNPGFNG